MTKLIPKQTLLMNGNNGNIRNDMKFWKCWKYLDINNPIL